MIVKGNVMTEKNREPVDNMELRRSAEGLLGEVTGTAHPPVTNEDLQRLHHELQVHQIELELQNAELRQSRDALEAALEKYTDLYDFSPVGYFTLDRKGIILSVNLTGAALVAVERTLLVGRHFELFVTAESRPAFSDFLGEVFTSPTKIACELVLAKNGGDPVCVEVEGITVSGECRIALIDITERKLTEESLRRARNTIETFLLAKKSAEETSRLKSQFLANMSHELRTPMAIVFGMLDALLLGYLEAEQREYIKIAQTSARSLLRILNDMLLMAQVEAGKLRIEENPFSLQDCITQAVDITTPEMHRKNLDFSLSVAEDVPDKVIGDKVKVRQVLLNLMNNAVKFTEEGKVAVRITVGKANAARKREFTFTVTDSGIGIPDDKKSIIFQPFIQADASPTRKFGGTGLGLAISREIVELMEGTISFESEEGAGSSFSFTIPMESVVEKEEGYVAAVCDDALEYFSNITN